MAKRRTTKRKITRRRRGVGSTNTGNTLMNGAYVLAGVAICGVINKTVLAGKSPMIQALVPIAGGVALGMFIKSDLGKYAGLGMIAGGGTKLLQKFNIAGLGDDSIDVPLSISGDGLSLIAGASDNDLVMAGVGDDDDYMGADQSLSLLAGIDEED